MPKKLFNELLDAFVSLQGASEEVILSMHKNRPSAAQVRTAIKWIKSATVQLRAADLACRKVVDRSG